MILGSVNDWLRALVARAENAKILLERCGYHLRVENARFLLVLILEHAVLTHRIKKFKSYLLGVIQVWQFISRSLS